MRPTEQHTDGNVYECTGCGTRVTDPDTRLCEACGGEFINLSKSRDL